MPILIGVAVLAAFIVLKFMVKQALRMVMLGIIVVALLVAWAHFSGGIF